MVEKMVKDFTFMKNSYETILYKEENQIGYLTINRATKLNALNIQVLNELKDILRSLLSQNLNGLIFTGDGEKAFIAGADISEMRPMSKSDALAFSELGHQVTLGFEALPYPTIACVNGFALGGGFEMALSCDFIFASKNAVFGLPEVKLGLIPGFGGTQRLQRIVGERRAKELMFSGRNVTSDEAKSLGIALEVYADKAQLMSEAKAWIEKMSSNSLKAIAVAKDTLWKGGELALPEGLKFEAKAFSDIFETQDMIEGTAAFIEKRKPNFN
jgi:enoyl-CoA hydratase